MPVGDLLPGLVVVLRLEDFAPTVKTVGGYVVTQVKLTGSGLDSDGRITKPIVRTAHTAP